MAFGRLAPGGNASPFGRDHLAELLSGGEPRQVARRYHDGRRRLAWVPRDPLVPALALEGPEPDQRDPLTTRHRLPDHVHGRIDHPTDVRLARARALGHLRDQSALVHVATPRIRSGTVRTRRAAR